MGTKSAWTPERRARQAERIRSTRPWEQSTGPKTEAGKAISSQNARLSDNIWQLRLLLAAGRAFSLGGSSLKRLPPVRLRLKRRVDL